MTPRRIALSVKPGKNAPSGFRKYLITSIDASNIAPTPGRKKSRPQDPALPITRCAYTVRSGSSPRNSGRLPEPPSFRRIQLPSASGIPAWKASSFPKYDTDSLLKFLLPYKTPPSQFSLLQEEVPTHALAAAGCGQDTASPLGAFRPDDNSLFIRHLTRPVLLCFFIQLMKSIRCPGTEFNYSGRSAM